MCICVTFRILQLDENECFGCFSFYRHGNSELSEQGDDLFFVYNECFFVIVSPKCSSGKWPPHPHPSNMRWYDMEVEQRGRQNDVESVGSGWCFKESVGVDKVMPQRLWLTGADRLRQQVDCSYFSCAAEGGGRGEETASAVTNPWAFAVQRQRHTKSEGGDACVLWQMFFLVREWM